MTLRFRNTHGTTSRFAPRLEALESRHLFAIAAETSFANSVPFGPSALTNTLGGQDLGALTSPQDLSTLSVVQTNPENGSVLTVPPTALIVTFNQLFPTFLLGNDIGLKRVDANGTVLEDLSSRLDPPFDLLDDSSVLPVTVSGVLLPGRYQILVLGSTSELTGVGSDGQPGAPLANRGIDQVVSTFTIAPKPEQEVPVKLANATDLGMVGPVPIVTAGSLGFGSDLNSSRYYKFTLAPGHFWRLGAEVTAQRDHGNLNSIVTLLDAKGLVIKTANLGRSGAPFDPYLFAGLASGTYYLEVSREHPDNKALDDVLVGNTSGPAPDDTSFRLHVLAQVADTPTTLLDSRLIYSDPLDPRPTGIVLVFSGPMDLESFRNSTGPGGNSEFKGLELVDANGQAWSLTPTSYLESNSQYSFLFSKPLPKGQYTLRIPTAKGVTDLAGRSPVASGNKGADLSNGILTSWTVASDAPTEAPNNLGTILNDAGATVPRTNILTPQSSANYRFVIAADGYYTIESTASSESFLIQMRGRNGAIPIPGGRRSGLNSTTLYLTAGVYSLDLKAAGPDPVKLSFSLFKKLVAPEAIFDNGVGQGPALNLAFITPVPLSPTSPGGIPVPPPELDPAPDQGPGTTPLPPQPPIPTDPGGVADRPPLLGPAPGQGPGSANPGSPAPATPAPATPTPGLTASITSIVSSTGANGLVLTLGSGLIGSPVEGAEHVAAVGPGTQSGTTALAANTPGLLQGIQYGQSLSLTPTNLSSSDGQLDSSEVNWKPVPSSVSTAGTLATVEPPIAPSGDERVIASPSDWLGGLGTMLLHGFWITPGSPAPITMEAAPAEPIEQVLLSRDDVQVPADESQVEHANLAAPVGFGLVSVLALRLQQPIRRWVERRRGRVLNRRSAMKPIVRGPYKRD